MQKLYTTLLLAAMLLISFGAMAQDAAEIEEDIIPLPAIEETEEEEGEEESKFSLSGSADAYFRASVEDQAPATSFANLPGFQPGDA